MAEKTVASRPRQQATTTEVTRSPDRYLAPPVDIYETADGLVVMADLPGVAKEALDVRVENGVLTLHGRATHASPGDPIYREFEIVNFYRQFELGDKVDQAKIAAELKHGVLTLHLPKAEEAKPRRVEVKVA
jgi:HSP20 family molecular chaperone IbpA